MSEWVRVVSRAKEDEDEDEEEREGGREGKAEAELAKGAIICETHALVHFDDLSRLVYYFFFSHSYPRHLLEQATL
jgi:hypothetical protein